MSLPSTDLQTKGAYQYNIMTACLFVCDIRTIFFVTCERDSRREGVICTREQKQNKTKQKKKKYIHVQIVHFYRLLQVDFISKRENSLGYISRQVNSLTGLSLVMFFA